ncbi:hypothetical protein N7532_010340 [Penicillium argentinense]|uniref:Uncharacterized protein n=1 Tax=Penicillium argentinense TaxID=1131581 RepID=A0A9W9EPS8_9EURO|nr:uncharacterized protein N7532_010340 [Penicillium argentinense]KAJ5085569.1 hypothetical protein N7532_010340 [Penicillium argentinense]
MPNSDIFKSTDVSSPHLLTWLTSQFSLQGRTALPFARGLAEAGANVAVFDVIPPGEEFHAIANELGARTAYYKVDVSSVESLQNGFEQFQNDFDNALDICVPCAGINRHLPFLEFTYKDHHDLLAINVLGLYFTAQLAAKQMIKNGTKHGSIVLVASMASHVAVRSQLCSAYCGSKGAVRSMCPAIAKELAEYGIRVNSISPGYVQTEMTAAFPHLLESWKLEAMNGRVAEPEDIMGACVFLASDASAYMTGQDVIVDGGSPAGYIAVPVDASTTVVVVGAGPSGLMLACNLVRYGMDVVILDDCPEKTSTGKADGMQPKTIETFKQMRLAEPLLKNSARVYDISFWQSTADKELHRTGRLTHYPDRLVGASDPFILLAHQGMVEEVLIDDMESRGVFVARNSRFASCSRVAGTAQLDVTYEDVLTNTTKTIRTSFLVGCDGARSKVRNFIPDAELEGDITNASWGVLDGVIDTDFPDLWSKAAVRSHAAGSILWIPRERNMTRLYVELSATDGERVDRAKATPEYVIDRARKAMQPFRLEWKSREWFGNYVVGQRVARHFMDADARIFIAGDAGHCHSALAAQGANTSMHDSFNLAWKLNLVARGLAKQSLLSTYEEERRKIANDLISFDTEHCKAFAQGEAALSKNFDDNIRFISGVGAEYAPGMLSRNKGASASSSLCPGSLQLPAKVTRYIDANPVDIQLDIPLLSQFRIYLFVPDVPASLSFLNTFNDRIASSVFLSKAVGLAEQSYAKRPRGYAPSDEFIQPQRYTKVSSAFTFAMVTQSAKSKFEITDLPKILQDSRWTLYLDDVNTPSCTDVWFGNLKREQVGIAIVRPDGYVGGVEAWDLGEGEKSVAGLEDYFSFML